MQMMLRFLQSNTTIKQPTNHAPWTVLLAWRGGMKEVIPRRLLVPHNLSWHWTSPPMLGKRETSRHHYSIVLPLRNCSSAAFMDNGMQMQTISKSLLVFYIANSSNWTTYFFSPKKCSLLRANSEQHHTTLCHLRPILTAQIIPLSLSKHHSLCSPTCSSEQNNRSCWNTWLVAYGDSIGKMFYCAQEILSRVILGRTTSHKKDKQSGR